MSPTGGPFITRQREAAANAASTDTVPAPQRTRMLRAMTNAVADKGYAAVTVADVVGRAGVSRTTFYEHFKDKEHCFLAAYASGTGFLADAIIAAVRDLGPDPPWERILDVAIDTYVGTLADHPAFARTFLIDVIGAGPAALERRRRVHERFVDLYRHLAARIAEQEPDLGEVPDAHLRALVGGMSELVQQHMIERGAESLRELGPVLKGLVTALIRGAGARPR